MSPTIFIRQSRRSAEKQQLRTHWSRYSRGSQSRPYRVAKAPALRRLIAKIVKQRSLLIFYEFQFERECVVFRASDRLLLKTLISVLHPAQVDLYNYRALSCK